MLFLLDFVGICKLQVSFPLHLNVQGQILNWNYFSDKLKEEIAWLISWLEISSPIKGSNFRFKLFFRWRMLWKSRMSPSGVTSSSGSEKNLTECKNFLFRLVSNGSSQPLFLSSCTWLIWIWLDPGTVCTIH